jgi:hypothetical protein
MLTQEEQELNGNFPLQPSKTGTVLASLSEKFTGTT